MSAHTRRAGAFAEHVNQIVLGTAALSAETALRLERVTGVPADVWTELEADYQVAQTRQEELARLERQSGWLRTFPVSELIRRGYIRQDVPDVEQLRDRLLSELTLGALVSPPRVLPSHLPDSLRISFGTGGRPAGIAARLARA